MQTRAFAALSATSPLCPHTITRREPLPRDVEIDILYCGVCHTDLHFVRNEWGMTSYPLVPGHEILGRVKRVGGEVTRFEAGDLAAVGCLVDSCRTCSSCRQGLEQFCLTGPVMTYGWPDKHSGGMTFGGYS
ncbi:MAG TPA: alcohol dehydrogenase catalytic domain-containing protein, partial [Vicinamibacteria bacterium]|nr:alcohol dehydrogenase catalytic domain-containing protein [Vicinamibacteria bacterium]